MLILIIPLWDTSSYLRQSCGKTASKMVFVFPDLIFHLPIMHLIFTVTNSIISLYFSSSVHKMGIILFFCSWRRLEWVLKTRDLIYEIDWATRIPSQTWRQVETTLSSRMPLQLMPIRQATCHLSGREGPPGTVWSGRCVVSVAYPHHVDQDNNDIIIGLIFQHLATDLSRSPDGLGRKQNLCY